MKPRTEARNDDKYMKSHSKGKNFFSLLSVPITREIGDISGQFCNMLW